MMGCVQKCSPASCLWGKQLAAKNIFNAAVISLLVIIPPNIALVRFAHARVVLDLLVRRFGAHAIQVFVKALQEVA